MNQGWVARIASADAGAGVQIVTRDATARLRSYRIEVNGTTAGSIRRGETKTFHAPSGRVVVRARIDWTGSNVWEGDLGDGARAHLVVGHVDGNQLYGLFSGGEYLSLRSADGAGSVSGRDRRTLGRWYRVLLFMVIVILISSMIAGVANRRWFEVALPAGVILIGAVGQVVAIRNRRSQPTTPAGTPSTNQ